MSNIINQLKNKVFSGELINKEEAIQLINGQTSLLAEAANEIRKKFCGNKLDLCSVISGRTGNCSEDCKFCAQYVCYNGECRVQDMISYEDFKKDAVSNYEKGISRFGIVSAGKRITDAEVDILCDSYRRLKEECNIPKAQIRLAAGRLNLMDKGKRCFESGANAAISGNMITINGVNLEEDIKNLKKYVNI